jgi:5-amino-6-(5-phospho-D-ribitylamino)uracil phosphatase
MGAYKLIALDMDGTLLTEDKKVSEENQAALLAAREAGITVMFATGRGIQNVLTYAEELKLMDAPLVAVNGSEVYRKPGDLLERHVLQAEQVHSLHQLAVKYDTWFWAYTVGDIFNKDRWVQKKELEERPWLKFGYYTEDLESLTAIRSEITSWGNLELSNSHPCNLELNPKGIHKAYGISKVCELLGLDMSQVIAMGDSLNDVTMIREAGLGVAMGNAQDEVKALADTVTLTNEEHGVAHIIHKYALA